jgi:hypothetical protein
MVIVSAMESTTMATAQVGSMWQKPLTVAHGGEVELCVLGAVPSSNYFDVRRKSAVADMLPAEMQSFKANSKCVAAETYAP